MFVSIDDYYDVDFFFFFFFFLEDNGLKYSVYILFKDKNMFTIFYTILYWH